VQCLKQQDASMVARKRPAGAIGAMHPGCQPHNQESRLHVAEWRDWLAIIVRVALADRIEKTCQAWARAAIFVKNRFFQTRAPLTSPS